MYWSVGPVGLVSPLMITVTSTSPLPAGLVAVQVVVAQLTPVAGTPPKATRVVPAVVLKFVPLIVTTVPPAAGPLVGLIPVTVGTGGGGGGGRLILSSRFDIVF